MLNYYFKSKIDEFIAKSTEEIIGAITMKTQFDATTEQIWAWEQQITILKKALYGKSGTIFFEFSIPRMGRRVDAIAIIQNVVFVIEFKVGESKFNNYSLEQVWDYALDLKNFHKPSHNLVLAPILVATEAQEPLIRIATTNHNDKILIPIYANKNSLSQVIENVLEFEKEELVISGDSYANGSYSPTPTIIEAAVSIYNSHTVDEITRSDADAKNLTVTTEAISKIIEYAKQNRKKAICFVTGVPGAGKTLVGLKVAISHLDREKGDSSVYLSGNAPLVAILQEALTRDRVQREKESGKKISKMDAKQGVKAFIQIIHHYRDEYLKDKSAPYDHVAIFDEAQRAWDKHQTVDFMKRKKNQPNFSFSEPEFLISCLDRHEDWAVVICLVGGGQEINTGEAGISEWLRGIKDVFSNWEVFISPNLTDSEYAAEEIIDELKRNSVVKFNQDLHLAVSMRSFRAEKLSSFVKNLLDLNVLEARSVFSLILDKYPIFLTRNLATAKKWLKEKARGSERYGIVVSSKAERLRPLAIDVRYNIDPVHWFLNGKDDVRSSYYLEDVATEFHIQGLELDWVGLTWDGDLRHNGNSWETFEFKGNKWLNIRKDERQKYLVNAYRVLLTRARQGMIIIVPEGNSEDHTRLPEYYDGTFNYLKSLGIPVI
ncbi:MAG TPA: DUF2075 domain-containing protein [bacterium]|nr:DUF2075 domain-containing protein [bacterium]HQN73183.1 DUF2075 domain-containing protein [bacterium]